MYTIGIRLYTLRARAGKNVAEVAQKGFAFRKIKYFVFVMGRGDIYCLRDNSAKIDLEHEYLMWCDVQ
jgi:hypothetical protein